MDKKDLNMGDSTNVHEIFHSRSFPNVEVQSSSATESDKSIFGSINVESLAQRFNKPSKDKSTAVPKWEEEYLRHFVQGNKINLTDISMKSEKKAEEIRSESKRNITEVTFPTVSDFRGTIHWSLFDEDDQRSDQVLGGTWGRFALEREPWKDTFRPFINIKTYSELDLTSTELDGVLSDRVIAACSSYLEMVPEKGEYAATKVQLSNKNLRNIRVLAEHHYLQFIDLSSNHLTDVSCLGQCPFLMYLDVSNNRINTLLNFDAPWNLTYVNYSGNEISQIPDLKDFWSICYLDLSYNQITVIEGIQSLKYLRTLLLSDNLITHIENLTDLRIEDLDLRNNRISTFAPNCLRTLNELQWVHLQDNYLKTLSLFSGVAKVKTIDMSNNKIKELLEVNHLRGRFYLTKLELLGNPITVVQGYREVCIDTVHSLTILDGIRVEIAEKVAANITFSPNLILNASRTHAKMVMLQHLTQPLLISTIPFDQGPHPMIVLVGPPGSNKRTLIQKFVREYPKRVYRAISHTTRPLYSGEQDHYDYHFVNRDEFNRMANDGEFICIHEILGNSYGFSHMELMKAVEKRAVCILHTALTSALVLRLQGCRPTLILSLPKNEKKHLEWITEKYSPVFWDSKNTDAGAILLHGNVDVKCNEDMRRYTSVSDILSNTSDICCPCDCECDGHPNQQSVISETIINLDSTIELTPEPSDSMMHSLSSFLDSTSTSDYLHSVPGFHVAPDVVCDFFTQYLFQLRTVCFELHDANPGLFADTLFTDEPSLSVVKLRDIVKQAVQNYPDSSPCYQFRKDEVYVNMVQHKLDDITRQLETHRNTAEKQRQTKMTIDPDHPLPSETCSSKDDIINKYSNMPRIDPVEYTLQCPAHMLPSTYRAFDV